VRTCRARQSRAPDLKSFHHKERYIIVNTLTVAPGDQFTMHEIDHVAR
jgi:hypothetical protein